jgi:hypothetical protein
MDPDPQIQITDLNSDSTRTFLRPFTHTFSDFNTYRYGTFLFGLLHV